MRISKPMRVLALAAAMLMTAGTLQAQTADQDTTVVIPETGILPIKPSRNFTGDKGLIVCSIYGSANQSSTGIVFTKYGLDSVVVASSINSGSGLFLLGKPGTYKLTLTDAAETGRISNTVLYWRSENSTPYMRSRLLYKFINQPGRIGFERDEKYAAEKYQYCDLGAGENIYIPLANNNLTIMAKLLSTTAEELSFIPWDGPWKNVPTAEDIEAAGIKSLSESTENAPLYDLQGRKTAVPGKGIYIRNGKKYVR